ncbi:MAG TPA: serine/threonine-protein kinase [Candidatus Deferrimicrobium sp.]|nr:serine/threonine-protein kinase [Candidatus Deferrimicrobium sp.]
MELMPEIPGYKILKKIGEGATSTVYMGIQDKLERKVAIKILKPQLVDSDYSPRFLREAKIASNLTHPNIVTIHDISQTAHYYYIVMEYLGESLKDRLRSGGSGCLPGDEALRIVKQVSGALQYAHSEGVVHREMEKCQANFFPKIVCRGKTIIFISIEKAGTRYTKAKHFLSNPSIQKY